MNTDKLTEELRELHLIGLPILATETAFLTTKKLEPTFSIVLFATVLNIYALNNEK